MEKKWTLNKTRFRLRRTSGAQYAGVPQAVMAPLSVASTMRDRPKSATVHRTDESRGC